MTIKKLKKWCENYIHEDDIEAFIKINIMELEKIFKISLIHLNYASKISFMNEYKKWKKDFTEEDLK